MQRKLLPVLLIIAILTVNNSALAWNGISHYHINQATGLDLSSAFAVNGTGPDMSVQWTGHDPEILDENSERQSWADYFHSPNPKILKNTRPYSDKPNFAYLMLKASGKNGTPSGQEKSQALGWGGHIAADWVAHNDNLFPICPDGSIGSIKHFMGECLCELYSFIKSGGMASPADVSIAFDDKQIYKALLNYRLISIHENYLSRQQDINDQKLKEKAIQTTLPRSYIRERIKRWVAKLAVIQFAYTRSSSSWSPVKRALFLSSMEQRGITSNLALSDVSVRSWVNNPTPRGGIPDYSKQVVSFYKEKLISASSATTISLGFSQPSTSSMQAGPYKIAQSPKPLIEERDDAMWQGVIDKSLSSREMVIAETETADGRYLVDVSIQDEERLWQIIEKSVSDLANSDAPEAAVFWRKLLIEGMADPTALTDIAPPAILIQQPLPGSRINVPSPEIRIQVADDLDGAGIDPESISVSLDGATLEHSYNEGVIICKPAVKLKDGSHRLLVTVSDLSGNRAGHECVFELDTITPKPCYKVKNATISNKKPQAEVLVTPDEPVRYVVRVYPIVKGRPGANPVYIKDLGQQKAVYWGGVDDNGQKIAAGNYLMQIQLVDLAGNTRTISVNVKVDKSW